MLAPAPVQGWVGLNLPSARLPLQNGLCKTTVAGVHARRQARGAHRSLVSTAMTCPSARPERVQRQNRAYCGCACLGRPALSSPNAVSIVSAKGVIVWLCSAPSEQHEAVRVAMRFGRV
jgi:hypothetical protein